MKKVILEIILLLNIVLLIFMNFGMVKAAEDSYSYISRILPRTSVVDFIKKFNISSDKIHIYKSGTNQEVKRGYIATDMDIKFDGVEKTYKASVIGDLNGDGIANQIELQHLIKHIVIPNKSTISGIKLLSADINGDGSINQIDLTILINYIVFGRLNVEEMTLPQETETEIKDEDIGIIMKLNDKNGEEYESGVWTNQSVYIEAIKTTEVVEGTEIEIETTYTITGTVSALIPSKAPLILKNSGEYIINATATDTLGRSKTKTFDIKIDKENPSPATIQIDEEITPSGYYNLAPNITVIGGKDQLSGIEKITYQLSGDEEIEETVIEDNQKIQIQNEGTVNIKIKTYDNVGNISETTETLRIDKTKPENLQLKANNITSKSFDLQANAEDNLSGIQKYEFFVDDKIIKTEPTAETSVNISVLDQETGKHIVKMLVTDNAENVSELEIEVKNTRLEESDVDHVVFEIKNVNVTNGEQEDIDTIISNRSISIESKFIQLSTKADSEEGIKAELQGIVKIIRKDGLAVSDVDYFPENLLIEAKYIAGGSGISWASQSTLEVLGIEVYNGEKQTEIEEQTKQISMQDIIGNNLTQNDFTITETKKQGVSTFSRLIISKVSMGEGKEEVPFALVNSIL